MILELPERSDTGANGLQKEIEAKQFFKRPGEENVKDIVALPRRIRIARESLGRIPVI
jgi:hypothetical protein